MDSELVIKGIVFLGAAVILIRGIMKLPKPIAIAFSVFTVLSMATITYLCIYQFDIMNELPSYVNMELETNQ